MPLILGDNPKTNSEPDLPPGEALYLDLVESLGELNFGQQMEIANHLRAGTAWTQLPQWVRDVFVDIDPGDA